MRAGRGALLSAGCALALLGLMFALAWYGVDGIPGSPNAHRVVWTENGWDGLTAVRWVMLITIVASIAAASPYARLGGRLSRRDIGGLVLALGSLTSALLIYRVLIELPSSSAVADQKLGAVLGLAAALGIVIGGWDTFTAQQEHAPRARTGRRGEQPSGPSGS
jgi:hypothetical protein